MALTVTWPTPSAPAGNIYIPKADTTLVSAGPPEVRSYDMNSFRGELGTLWASSVAPWASRPFSHSQEVTISGYTYARGVQILTPYRVEFENGLYVVQIFGANHNVLDVIEANSVGVVTQNSAGLINVLQLDEAAYAGEVWLSQSGGAPGTRIGTNGIRTNPVDNWADALTINAQLGFGKIHILGANTVAAPINIAGLSVMGDGPSHSSLNILSGSTVGVQLEAMTVTDVLTGMATLRQSLVGNLTGISGFIYRCGLVAASTVVLDGVGSTTLLECWALGEGVEIDCNGSGSALYGNEVSGILTIVNKTGADAVSIGMSSGYITLDSTVTAGTIVLSGLAEPTDNSGAAAIVFTDGLLVPSRVTEMHETGELS